MYSARKSPLGQRSSLTVAMLQVWAVFSRSTNVCWCCASLECSLLSKLWIVLCRKLPFAQSSIPTVAVLCGRYSLRVLGGRPMSVGVVLALNGFC